jgi:hypothetical protein
MIPLVLTRSLFLCPSSTESVWRSAARSVVVPFPQGGYATGPPPPQQQQHWGPPQGQCGSEKRHSVCFKFTGTSETILNSQIHDPYGKTPFVVATDKKKHTTVRASNGTTLALIDWDRPSPVMHYQGKNVKCKEWLVCERAKESVLRRFLGAVSSLLFSSTRG